MAFAWYSYDAFLSHAVEDKAAIADELCKQLREKKLRVWYSGDCLVTGSDISSQVHTAIKKSRNGIFILSRTFIEKEWTKREYYLMKSRDGKDGTIVFPIFLNLKSSDVARMDPNLVDIYGLDTGKGADAMAAKITIVIKAKKARRYFWRSVVASLIVVALLTMSIVTQLTVDTTSKRTSVGEPLSEPPAILIEKTIADRLGKLEATIEKDHLITTDSRTMTSDRIQALRSQFRNEKSRFRNEFDFNDGTTIIRARKNVEKLIGFDPATIVPGDNYIIKAAYAREANDNIPSELAYSLETKDSVKWTIYKPAINAIPYVVTIAYKNRVRLANIFLTFPLSSREIRYSRVHLFGLPTEEHYEFSQVKGVWVLAKIY